MHPPLNPRRRQQGSVGIVLIVGGTLLLVVLGFWLLSRFPARPTAARVACINHLRQIDGAKEQWSLERKATKLTVVNLGELANYIKGGMPACPDGGTYFVNLVGLPPQCSKSRYPLSDSCHFQLQALNNAAQLWLRDHPESPASAYSFQHSLGFGKPLHHMPVCERGGQYRFHPETATVHCTLEPH